MKVLVAVLIIVLTLFSGTGETSSDSYIYKGMASWYSEEDPGVLDTTANMEQFDDSGFTCAMWDIPFNTVLKVTNTENGRSVFVRVNDRGPAKRLVKKGRIIDLTKKAFSMLDNLEKGLIRVKIEII